MKKIKPVRLQRSRQHKLVSPNGLPCVYVGRPTRWGNPYRVSVKDPSDTMRQVAVDCFRHRVLAQIPVFCDDIRKGLKGKNLVCWCPKDKPCHADVLLEIANG